MDLLATTSSHATWYGNLHEVLDYPWIIFVLVLTSLVPGWLIGIERRSRGKPVGIRTVTLICMGSAIFTLVSILISRKEGDADPGRIAAQVVSGIGFLGAGAILHSKNRVRGLTTAATIWVVAAIGVLIGAGYAFPAVIISIFVVVLLRLHWYSQFWGHGKNDETGPSPPTNYD
ncbi:MAG TPA: MgtC/SapB family protein [Phycisphaerae bacterium]|nr:MgtC/SapB family protein [Phycisphaerae bacterium]HOJ76037.1 MgtC/SapB family protein [Phycisphaerae bacterium]HOM53078.1 MgtC/SapB family protein [Phycisphaerae bacterium]HON69025.1 MgtC/SapB family protein [Phycisphaerae bacterium]HOQ86095.1 MgtC/SapB family protein [Phycisphaerae bacterium]